MERYPKLFIKASIIYLLFGVIFGLLMSVHLLKNINPAFIHVHLNLVGFMSMMIFGIAYHVLPRFNAKPIKIPSLISLHFYLGNLGLTGLVLSYLMGGYWDQGIWKALFAIFAIMLTVSILLFIFNMFPVLMEQPEDDHLPKKNNPLTTPFLRGVFKAPAKNTVLQVNRTEKNAKLNTKDAQKKEPEMPVLNPDMKVAEVLRRWPDLLSVFADSGFKALTNPAARATFAKIVTIKKACQIHKVELKPFMDKLMAGLNSKEKKVPSIPPTSLKFSEHPVKQTKPTIKRGEKCTEKTLIGDIIKVYPESAKVFAKHYGAGCFSCPGQATETVEQTAMMHGIEVKTILSDINAEIGT